MLVEGTTLTVGTHNVEVVRYLCKGGFSKIYEVTMDPPEGDTDIGCLKQVIVPDKNGLNTLRKEVDVMKTLRKARSIVKYYDSNAERLPDGSYQVLVLMELCPNNSLLDYMNERIRLKLSESEILKIMLDISVGVYEMHKIKLIHRDIKIENVLIGAKNDFKLGDFGSVSAPIRPPQDHHEFQLLGHDILYHTTPQYRSPEMIDVYRGCPIDERSDIWALGCFLYKLCYYTTPFEANGEIAILHASFQFPSAPLFSGDLKNLIIIMLQENPLYRPNIVQILVLVAKLMSTDYDSLAVEDFYGAGEYDFQALHRMQREKHEHQIRQQQYYIEQQKQQQAYERRKQKPATSKSSLRASPLHLSRENSVHVKDEGTPASSLKVDQEYPAKGAHISAIEGNTVHGTGDSIPGFVSVRPVSPQTSMAHKFNDDDSSSDSADLDVELPELDNIAERYPSLDEFVYTAANDEVELRRNSSLYKGRPSLDTNGNEFALENSVSCNHSGVPPADAAKSRTDLKLIDAWQTGDTSKFDERTEKLADEIFAVSTGGLSRTKSAASATSAKSTKSTKSSKGLFGVGVDAVKTSLPGLQAKNNPYIESLAHAAQGVQGLNSPLKSDTRLPHEILKAKREIGSSMPQFELESTPIQIQDRRFAEQFSQPVEYSPPLKHYENFHHDVSKAEPKRASSNPWSSAISSPSLDPHGKGAQDTKRILLKHMSHLNLGPHAETTRKRSTEVDLIDLGGSGMSMAGIVAPDHFNMPGTMEVSGAKAVQNTVSNLLIDMDFGTNNLVKFDDSKPIFKKRISEKQPQQLNFEEQVIDFASDDENHKSEMSRMAIRNSLKKSRKHSEHRRSDSAYAEGKKKLSFFGGASE